MNIYKVTGPQQAIARAIEDKYGISVKDPSQIKPISADGGMALRSVYAIVVKNEVFVVKRKGQKWHVEKV